MEKRFISVDDLAIYLDISKNTIYSWIWQKRIPHCKMGRLVKFDLREIEAWTEKHKAKLL